MKAFNQSAYKTMEDGESTRLPVGGYICKITSAEDIPEKEYIRLEFDIEEGEYKGYFADAYTRFGFWQGSTIRSYKETARSMFNGFIAAVEKSNPGYKWDWNEKGLVGRHIGVVISEREYISKKNEIKVGIEARQIRNVEIIRSGEYKVPDMRRLSDEDRARAVQPSTAPAGFTETQDDDCPF